MTTENEELLDYGDYPRVEIAGVADAYMLGYNRACFVCFDWCKIRGVLQRKTVLEVRRPLIGLRQEQSSFWNRIFRASAEIEGVAVH